MLHERYKYDGIPIVQLNNVQQKALDNVKLKYEKGIYKFEKIPCCVCKKFNFELLSEKDRLGFYNPVVICKTCGLIQNNPRMTQDSYRRYYMHDYRKLFDGIVDTSDISLISNLEYQRGKKIYSFLKKTEVFENKTKDFFIFEVGCGSGGILKYFQDKGFIVQGCDLDDTYLGYGKKKFDLTLFHGTLKEMKFERTPNLIIYSHVMEHILYPDEELKNIREILNKEGYLFIEVPGITNVIDYNMDFLLFLHCHHVYHFSLTTLRNLLGINGFRLIKAENSIRCISKRSESILSESEIINNYIPALKFLQILEKLRKSLIYKKIIDKIKYFFKNNLNSYENLRKTIKNLPDLLISLLLRYIKQINIFKGLAFKVLKKLK